MMKFYTHLLLINLIFMDNFVIIFTEINMIILREAKQINDKINELINYNAFIDNDERFISENISTQNLKDICSNVLDLSDKKALIDDISQLIFQLKDYMFAVGNLVKIFLITNNYYSIYYFLTRIFVAHLGNINYNSTQGTYNITERYFDRFIEVIKNTNIEPELFMPLILDIFRTDKIGGIANWKAPAVEFLQGFFNENEDWSIKFLQENKQLKYELLNAITEFNTPKGISLIIQDYITHQDLDKVQALHILKKYKRESLMTIDKFIADSEGEKRKSLLDILLNFDNDTEVTTRLQELYTKEKDEELKELIARRIGVTETLSIKTEKQYINAVRKNIKDSQERSLGVAFDKLKLRYESGYEADNAGKTFLIYLFKQEKNLENLKKLEVIKNVFNNEDLESFVYSIFESLMKKDDINQAKWCVRMTVLACENKMPAICYFVKTLLESNRKKEAKYLIETMLACGKKQVIGIIQKDLEKENSIVRENLDNFAGIFAKATNQTKQDVLDYFIPNEYTEKEYNKQKERVYNEFISNRMFTDKHLKNVIVKNNLLNKLYSSLVLGEYLQGRLYNAFVLENGVKKFLYGIELAAENKVIGIVHLLDLDDRSYFVKDYIKNPAFEQFESLRFNVEEFSRSSISVNRFCGMFVDLDLFTKKLLTKNFVINKAYDEIEYNSYVHIMPDLNLIGEVMLEKNVTSEKKTANIGMIHFLRFEDVLLDKGKYITTKANGVSVGSLPERYFDYVLNAVYEAAQK